MSFRTRNPRGISPASTIMVIGNDETSGDELVSTLKQEGMTATTVCNETWYLRLMSEAVPRAIIAIEDSDLKVWDICPAIRHEVDIPIIMIGSTDNDRAWVKAAAYEIDLYLKRPFSSQELAARIRGLIRRHNNLHRLSHPKPHRAFPYPA